MVVVLLPCGVVEHLKVVLLRRLVVVVALVVVLVAWAGVVVVVAFRVRRGVVPLWWRVEGWVCV